LGFWKRTSAAFQNRSFTLIWYSSASEHLGEWMEAAALFWLVRQLTPSPFLLGLTGFARFVPMIVVSLMGGVVADRFDRKKLLWISLAGFGAVSSAIWLLIVTGTIQVWHVIVLSLLVGIVTSFNHPARAALVPNLVKRDQLLNAISLDLLAVMLSRLIGMPLAGYLMAYSGIAPVIALRVIMIVVAIVIILPMKTPAQAPAAVKKSSWKDMTEGLDYLKKDRVVMIQVLLYLVPWFSSFSMQSLMPIFALDILKVDATGYGWLLTAVGLGSVLSVLGLASMGNYTHKGMILIVTGALMGIFTIGFGASQWFYVSLIFLVLYGIMSNGFSAVNTAVVQELIPDNVRGRIMSFRETTMALGTSGSLLAGFMAEFTGVRWAIALLGIVSLVVTLSLYRALPHLKKM